MSRPPFPHASPAQRSSDPAATGFDEAGIDACCRTLEGTFRDAPWYSCGRTWKDYAPAFRHALRVWRDQRGDRFEQVEDEMAREWPLVREQSRLTWPEARPAMLAIWRHAPAWSRGGGTPRDRERRAGNED